MSKCCFDPLKIKKKKVIALICVITKVYLHRASASFYFALVNLTKDFFSQMPNGLVCS